MKTNIGVFFGGRSTEHEISVISASQAMAAIDHNIYDVTPVYITKDGRWFTGDALMEVSNYRDPKKLLQQCTEVYMRPTYGDSNLYMARRKMFGSDTVAHLDVAIPVLHGANGEDGTIQGLFDLIGLPFAGCDVLASANGMDKITMKMILQACGVPVVDDSRLSGDCETGQSRIERRHRPRRRPRAAGAVCQRRRHLFVAHHSGAYGRQSQGDQLLRARRLRRISDLRMRGADKERRDPLV